MLSLVLFSLCINILVTELKDRECGGGVWQNYGTWFSVEINVEKSAVMRKKGINKCADQFRIGDEVLPWVSIYRYLGCLVDDSLNCSNMVEHRVKMGSRALGAWKEVS